MGAHKLCGHGGGARGLSRTESSSVADRLVTVRLLARPLLFLWKLSLCDLVPHKLLTEQVATCVSCFALASSPLAP